MEIFQRASKKKLRFETTKGLIPTEALWDLPLSGQLSLDNIAKKLNKQIRENEEESFVDIAPREDKTDNKLRFDIVLAVIASRIADKEKAAKAAETKAKKQMIMEIMNEKQNEEIKGMDLKDLQKMLDEL